MSGSGREDLLDVRELSGDPSRCPGVVKGTYEKPGVVEMPSGM